MTEERVQRLKQRFMSAYDVTADGKLQIQEVLHELYVLNHSPISFTIISFILNGRSLYLCLCLHACSIFHASHREDRTPLNTLKIRIHSKALIPSSSGAYSSLPLSTLSLSDSSVPLTLPSPLHLLFISCLHDNYITACTIFKHNENEFPGLLWGRLSHPAVKSQTEESSAQTRPNHYIQHHVYAKFNLNRIGKNYSDPFGLLSRSLKKTKQIAGK